MQNSLLRDFALLRSERRLRSEGLLLMPMSFDDDGKEVIEAASSSCSSSSSSLSSSSSGGVVIFSIDQVPASAVWKTMQGSCIRRIHNQDGEKHIQQCIVYSLADVDQRVFRIDLNSRRSLDCGSSSSSFSSSSSSSSSESNKKRKKSGSVSSARRHSADETLSSSIVSRKAREIDEALLAEDLSLLCDPVKLETHGAQLLGPGLDTAAERRGRVVFAIDDIPEGEVFLTRSGCMVVRKAESRTVNITPPTVELSSASDDDDDDQMQKRDSLHDDERRPDDEKEEEQKQEDDDLDDDLDDDEPSLSSSAVPAEQRRQTRSTRVPSASSSSSMSMSRSPSPARRSQREQWTCTIESEHEGYHTAAIWLRCELQEPVRCTDLDKEQGASKLEQETDGDDVANRCSADDDDYAIDRRAMTMWWEASNPLAKNTSFARISGATEAMYVPSLADVGMYVRAACVVHPRDAGSDPTMHYTNAIKVRLDADIRDEVHANIEMANLAFKVMQARDDDTTMNLTLLLDRGKLKVRTRRKTLHKESFGRKRIQVAIDPNQPTQFLLSFDNDDLHLIAPSAYQRDVIVLTVESFCK
jgi:hypothetical protein